MNRTEIFLSNLETLTHQIDNQMEVVYKTAKSMQIEPFALRDPKGSWVMVDLMLAKAQVLHARALVAPKMPGPKIENNGAT